MARADDRDKTTPPASPPLDTTALTWAALLGRWVEFARSAVGLPDDAAGRAMRESVPDVIMLQAVWFALQHVHDLPADERALGLDRAEVLIDKHETALDQRWRERPNMPSEMAQLIDDARKQLRALDTSRD